jgi:aryl-alcohol dehydrogenase-like predicted oxidoreductase
VETRPIGSLKATVVGLGCNNFGMRIDAEASKRVVDAAIESGINFFDTSDSYGPSEEYLRLGLGNRRDQVIIATKFGTAIEGQGKGASPAYIRKAVERSLRRLGTDRIDLYQIHRPDPDTPIAQTLGALDELVKAGKVREIGCSNFSAEQVRDAERVAKQGAARFVSVQNEYSLLKREAESGAVEECERQGLALLPYFPLANGLLTGKYRKARPMPIGTRISDMAYFKASLTEENLDRVERLAQFAEARGHDLLELAFSWLLARAVVASVIAGATSPQQVERNAKAAGWKLTEREMDEVDRIVPRV